MSKLATLQIIWPPVPSLVFVSLFDWIASFNDITITFGAFVIYVYLMFAPALIAVIWANKRGPA